MNNRQAGRRRGRGGQRSQGNPNQGSRIDNRARGNANQLYEKYKNLARDAQMQGDRVNTEYYLQFADHYFRVLNENRSRQEEQRRQRDDMHDGDDDDQDDRDLRDSRRGPVRDRGDDRHRDDQDQDQDEERPQRRRRAQRDAEPGAADTPTEDRAVQADREGESEAPAPKRPRGRPRKVVPAEDGAGIDADRLPPAVNAASNDDGEEKPRRRRTRTSSATSDAANPAG